MPIDASIYNAVQQPPSPIQTMAQLSQLKNSQQQQQIGALDLQEKQRGMAAETALNNAMSSALDASGNIDEQKFGQAIKNTPAAGKWPEIQQHFAAMREAKQKMAAAEADHVGSIAAAADAAGDDPSDKAAVLVAGIASGIKDGSIPKDHGTTTIQNMLGADGQPDPDKVKQTIAVMKAASEKQTQLGTARMTASRPTRATLGVAAAQGDQTATAALQAMQTPRAATTPALGSAADYLTRYATEHGLDPTKLTTAQEADALKAHAEATKSPVLSGMNALYNDVDPKAVAASIRRGEMPPDVANMSRPAAAAVMSELAKPGPNGERPFDLASANREWKAQINLNRTMNGSQQVRLDESIKSGLAMYDKIDQIADQWNSKGWGPLSRANLTAARNGAFGQNAASLANQLTGQIAQLTSDVATIEQGGLTPTNESRAVAEKSLQDWWSRGTIRDMTAQGRYNMQIRHLAQAQQEPKAPGNVGGMNQAPAQPATPATPTSAGRIHVVGPNGQTGTLPAGSALPPGWKRQ